MNIELYIEDTLVELSDKISYSLNRLFEDLNDPTTIINEWSKTISVPGTINNNLLFGSLYRADRQLVSGSGTGIYFDPTKKLDMRLMYNNDLVIHGYAKMNSISRKSGKITYNLTLAGLLGALFQEYKKITLDKAILDDIDSSKYYLDTIPYVNATMNKELIYNCWNKTTRSVTDIDSATDITDFIGFTPNNARMKEFSYKAYQHADRSTAKFEETLSGKAEFQALNIDADVVIPDGLSPRGLGEFRSYHQIPYIYVNKLFQMFKKKAESLCGYEWELDNIWFSDNNPYWRDLVFVLDPMGGDNQYNVPNSYLLDMRKTTYGGDNYHFFHNFINKAWNPPLEQVDKANVIVSTATEQMTIYDASTGYFELDESREEMAGASIIINGHFRRDAYAHTYAGIHQDWGYVINTHFINKAGTKIKTWKAILVNGTTAGGVKTYIDLSPYDEVCYIDMAYNDSDSQAAVGTPFTITPGVVLEEDFKIELEGYWIKTDSAAPTNLSPIALIYNSDPLWYARNLSHAVIFESLTLDINLNVGNNRSFSKFTLDKAWDMSAVLFDEILRYCKTFGILILVDDIYKKVKFIPRNTYFSKYTIENWDDKVDYSQDFIVNPVVNDNKYMKFQYEESDSNLQLKYLADYGSNYGEYKVTTNYNFNSESKDIMPKAISVISGTPNVLSWDNLYTHGRIVYSAPSETFLDCYDFEGEFVSQFGGYMFKQLNLMYFDTSEILHMRSAMITDDSDYMFYNNTYMYNQMSGAGKQSRRYSALTVSNSDGKTIFEHPVLCTYGKPMENYSLGLTWDVNIKSIYDIFWRNWLSERLSTNNKLVTCYAKLSPLDYMNFEFNHFVTIDNQLYMVNKIYDYDITGNKTTKVDLIQISDIMSYTTMPYWNYGISMDYPYGGYVFGDKDTTKRRLSYVYSLTDLNFTNGTKEYTDSAAGLKYVIELEEHTMLDGTYYNYTIYHYKVDYYPILTDINSTVYLTNGVTDTSAYVIRCNDYPNPAEATVGQIQWGTGKKFTVRLKTQYKPLLLTFSNVPTGLTITQGTWEYFNDDDRGYEMECTVNNLLYADATINWKIKTGSTYILNGTVKAIGNAEAKTILLSDPAAGYVPGDKTTTKYRLSYAHSYYGLKFSNGTTEYVDSAAGLKYVIEKEDHTMLDGTYYNYTVYYYKNDYYKSTTDQNSTATLSNGVTTATVTAIRYNDYPNPATLSNITIPNGTNLTFTVRLLTQYKPLELIFSGLPSTVTITQGTWEYFNDDDRGYEMTCTATNTTESDTTCGCVVKTGSNYILTKTVTIKGITGYIRTDKTAGGTYVLPEDGDYLTFGVSSSHPWRAWDADEGLQGCYFYGPELTEVLYECTGPAGESAFTLKRLNVGQPQTGTLCILNTVTHETLYFTIDCW